MKGRSRLDFFGKCRVFDVGSNEHDLIPARRLNSERSRGPTTIFIVEPRLPIAHSVWHDVHDVFFALRAVDVTLRQVIGADDVGVSPEVSVTAEKAIGRTFTVSWHVI